MPATTTRRRATVSLVVTVVLFLGLAAFSLAPLSCGTEPDEPSEKEAAQTAEANTDRAILLNIGIEDETEDRPLSDAFLLETPSGTHGTPGALAGGGATKAFDKHPVGETRTLRLYSEGEVGPAQEVPITMKPHMSSALASSRTNIFAYDDSIIISGPAVPDDMVVLDRPVSASP